MITITPAHRADLPAIMHLLTKAHLPLAGLDQETRHILIAKEGDQIVGCAALEVYGTVALLRSVAVALPQQGQRVGHRLVDAALAQAHERHVHDLYLPTETASDYFSRWGFTPIERDQADPAVQQSVEWHEACPASADVMWLSLVS